MTIYDFGFTIVGSQCIVSLQETITNNDFRLIFFHSSGNEIGF